MSPQVRSCPIYYWGKSRGQLLIATESMMWPGPNGNNPQLWIYLKVKIKSHDVRKNIA